ncbi:MAG: restriction endonuclease subunit S [Dehalococcoidia bacterium]|nr:MAG: restriction endonuclease subunit S [Dehalococcoidia bacterium]
MNELSYPVYIRFPDELGNRISYGDNHPERQAFYAKLETAKRKGFSLGRVDFATQLVDDEVNPSKEYPETAFRYLGLEGIQPNTGKAVYEFKMGKDIHSVSKRLHLGDIVFSGLRPYLNKCHIVDVQESLGSTELFVMVPDEDKVIPGFLLRYLLSDMVLQQTKWILTGSSYPRLDNEDFKGLTLVLPTKANQKVILAKILPLEKQIADKEAEAKQLTEEASMIILEELGLPMPAEEARTYFFKAGGEPTSLWFSVPSTELEDRLHYLFYHPKYSYLNKLNKKYKTCLLGSACRELVCMGEQVKEDENGTEVLLKTVNLKNDYIDFENATAISKETFEANTSAQAHKGDILLAATGYGSMGKVDIYERETPALIDGQISILRLNDDYDPYFITYLLRSHFGQLQIEKWWIGSSGQIHLPPGDIEKFVTVSCESLSRDEQGQIAGRITQKISKAHELGAEATARREEVNRVFEQLVLGTDIA